MFHETLPSELLRLIKPQQVRGYALAKGWQRVPGVNGEIALFNRPDGEYDQLIVPMDDGLDDYAKRLREVVENLAEVESRPVSEVLNDLISPDADIVRYRMASPATARGTIPLVEGIRLLDGAKRSILAAGCSVVNPVDHHPRMSRIEAQQLLNACNLGQTERESYSVSISCALRAVEQDQPLLPGAEPFTRRAVTLLMKSLARVVHSIEADAVPSMFIDAPDEPVVSANLCDALLQMQPHEAESHLDVKVSWATTLPPTEPLPDFVRIRYEYFPIIDDIAKKLRPALEPAASLFVGYIDTLSGEPGEDGRIVGEATVSVLHEEQAQLVRLTLSAEEWPIAHAALGVHGIVRFRGILHRGTRVHRIADIADFSRLE